ncbi:MAG TPA: HEAT repeat domain-containing protein [Candidatus Hydrogenedentes bacterium]|nr:HEAT repeat domain-containing protein [Candidatus Hydrogenedentota bacterium]HPJ99503.1 HEAT repeat domain-containing protein [Candidatus Hydrogenedentota bacterium]
MRSARLTIKITPLAMAALALLCWTAQANELDEFLVRIAGPNADARAGAWKSAGPLGAPAVLPLARLAETGEPEIRVAALRAIDIITAYAGRPGAQEEQRAVAQALADAVQSSEDSQLRCEFLHYLGLVASNPEVPMLARLLEDPAIGEDARIALERIPGDTATRALITALRSASSETVQLRMADALARRQAPEAIPVLTELAQSSGNRRLMFACLKALGAFGVPPHRVLSRRPSFTPEERVVYVQAALAAAYRLREQGENDEAATIYQSIAAYSNEPAHLSESILGLDAANAETFAAQALGYLLHPGVSTVAFRALVESQQKGLDEKLTLVCEQCEPPRKVAVLQILQLRNAESLPHLLEVARTDDALEVRVMSYLLSDETPPFEEVLTVARTGSEWIRPRALDTVFRQIATMTSEGATEAAQTACVDLLDSGLPEKEAVAAFAILEQIPSEATAAYLDSLDLWQPSPGAKGLALTPAALEAAQCAYVACAAAETNPDAARERLFLAAENSLFTRVTSRALEQLVALGVDRTVLARRQGFLTDWKIIGPFPNPDGTAFERSFLDETACTGREPVVFEGKTYAWLPVETDSVPAVIGLRARLDPAEFVAAYACAELTSPEVRDVIFQIGSDDGCELWINGERLHGTAGGRTMVVDQDKVDATLAEGVNRVLIKALQNRNDWQFCVRVTSRDGRPLDLSR